MHICSRFLVFCCETFRTLTMKSDTCFIGGFLPRVSANTQLLLGEEFLRFLTFLYKEEKVCSTAFRSMPPEACLGNEKMNAAGKYMCHSSSEQIRNSSFSPQSSNVHYCVVGQYYKNKDGNHMLNMFTTAFPYTRNTPFLELSIRYSHRWKC